MKRIATRHFITGVLVLVAGLAVPAAVLAHGGEDHSTPGESRRHEMTSQRSQSREARLTEAQKRICENRAKNIQAIMARSVKRAENYGQYFATITERVKHFIESQDGRPADASLIAAVGAAEAEFETDLASMKKSAAFSCDSADPKGQVSEFQEAHRTVLQDLKNWRSALKDLIRQYTQGMAS